ncbi:MAG: NAD-dependent epimerase/dehydratase family protein [Gammaproteobacteria bacterium]
MKILVTGGAGFIGSNLCEKLVSKHQVTSIDNYSIGLKENHIQDVEYIEGDVINISKQIENDFDVCFHLAGLSRIQPSFENPYKTFESNTQGVISVIEWCRTNNTKLIYSGSSSKHYNPYQSPYATFKYLGEEICKMYSKVYKMNIAVTRFYNVYGPREILSGQWAAVIGVWRNQVKNGEPITIVGDGEQRRDFTHVDDIIKALISLINNDNINIDAWELGTGVNYSINEVASMFVKKFNSEIKYIDDQPGNYRETLRKDSISLENLNWSPRDKLFKYIMSL